MKLAVIAMREDVLVQDIVEAKKNMIRCFQAQRLGLAIVSKIKPGRWIGQCTPTLCPLAIVTV